MKSKAPKKLKIDGEEAFRRKYEEEALDRKAKAGIQANNYNCSVKMAKFQIKKKSLVDPVICGKCGKKFKTNSNNDLCFDCQKKARQ